MRRFVAVFLTAAALTLGRAEAAEKNVRVAYLANLTHAQALVGRARGIFQEKLGSKIQIDWKVFNAGPSVIEAIFAGRIDIAYVGPSPAINGYVRSQGEALRVVAGSATEGSALVVRQGVIVQGAEATDFIGKKVATPQMGNTQDVALRSWFMGKGIKTQEVGGGVQVISADSAAIVTLFSKGAVDGAFVTEPWVSILEQKEKGVVSRMDSSFSTTGRFVTTLVVVRKKFLDESPERVRQFLEAHLEITRWINAHREEAKTTLSTELEKLTYKVLPGSILDPAFGRIRFDLDPLKGTVEEQAQAAYRVGYLKKAPDLSGLFDLRLLEEVREQYGDRFISGGHPAGDASGGRP